MRRTRLALWIGAGLCFGLSADTARAQIPLFYGGEVLMPLGNRRSDGSYIYPYQDPRNRARAQARAAAPVATTTTPRYYYPAGATYRVPQQPTYSYTTRRGLFGRRYVR